jgi:hypothetical protein
MPARINLIGKTFGRLKVIAYAPNRINRSGRNMIRITCVCTCGKITTIDEYAWGATKSCGCFPQFIATKTHGQSKTRTYNSWCSMIARCTKPANHAFSDYGGRGIKVCERWFKFENFLADMGQRPSRMSLGRKNNDGNYEPSNCRWETQTQQTRNMRSNVIVTVRGITGSLPEVCEHFQVPCQMVRARIRRKKTMEDAFFTPKYSKSGIKYNRDSHSSNQLR